MIRVSGISGDHCSVKVDIWRDETVENEASISEVREFESAEANKLEVVEVGLGVAKCNEKGLELFEMV